MKAIGKQEVFNRLNALEKQMREHVAYLVGNRQHFTAVRLEAYADDLKALIEKGSPRVRRAIRKLNRPRLSAGQLPQGAGSPPVRPGESDLGGSSQDRRAAQREPNQGMAR